jgi:hypothetical protein
MTRAFLHLDDGLPEIVVLGLQNSQSLSAWLHCDNAYFICVQMRYLYIQRSDAPPPAELRIQTAHSSSQGRLLEQRHSSSQPLFGSFRKSLPHLLPRRAFLF